MNNFQLTAFAPSTQTSGLTLTASVDVKDANVRISYVLRGNLAEILFPQITEHPSRVDGLYRHTCFELFLLADDGKYVEWNFSPSLDWCVFAFDRYRTRSANAMIEGNKTFSELKVTHTNSEFKIATHIHLRETQLQIDHLNTLKIQLSTVLESKSGTLSYWAIKHSAAKPDFHDAQAFTPIKLSSF